MLKTCHTCVYANWSADGLDPHFKKKYRFGHCAFPLPLSVKKEAIFAYKVKGRWCSTGIGCQIECPTWKEKK